MPFCTCCSLLASKFKNSGARVLLGTTISTCIRAVRGRGLDPSGGYVALTGHVLQAQIFTRFLTLACTNGNEEMNIEGKEQESSRSFGDMLKDLRG